MSKEGALQEKLLGNKAYEKRDFPASISHYEKAISLNPTEMVFHSNLAAVYLETQDFEKCIQSCETALNVGRQNGAATKLVAKTLRRMFNAHRKMGNHMIAEAILSKTIEIEKEVKLNEEENSKIEKGEPSKKLNFAEKLVALSFLHRKEKEKANRREDRKNNATSENAITFQVLGGGSCTECSCGNAKNIKTPTTGIGSRDDPIPYAELSDVERAVSMMINVDEIVVPEDRKSISVVFDYPLKEKFVFELKSPSGKGFTRGELVSAIGNKYKEIYKEEEETSELPVESISERSARHGGTVVELINRANTDGKYGIWGHDLGDLALSEVIFCPQENHYYLSIES